MNVLAIGDPDLRQSAIGQLPRFKNLTFRGYAEVTDAMLQSLRPSLIVSPVVAREFDCLDLAARLHELGYTAAYRAIARDLDHPDLVRAEIRRSCRGLDFDIISLRQGGFGPH